MSATDVFQAKARLAEAVSKRIDLRIILKFQYLILKIWKKSRINWFEANEKNIISLIQRLVKICNYTKNTKKFGDALKLGLESNQNM